MIDNKEKKVEIGVYSIRNAIFLYLDINQVKRKELIDYLSEEIGVLVGYKKFDRICIVETNLLYPKIDDFFNSKTVFRREENPFFPKQFEIKFFIMVVKKSVKSI